MQDYQCPITHMLKPGARIASVSKWWALMLTFRRQDVANLQLEFRRDALTSLPLRCANSTMFCKSCRVSGSCKHFVVTSWVLDQLTKWLLEWLSSCSSSSTVSGAVTIPTASARPARAAPVTQTKIWPHSFSRFRKSNKVIWFIGW